MTNLSLIARILMHKLRKEKEKALAMTFMMMEIVIGIFYYIR